MRQDYIQKILEYLEIHDAISTEEARRLLWVSEATVRRVFAFLTASGTVKRYHGGVSAIPSAEGQTIPFKLRTQWQSLEKAAIARRALDFIKPDSITFVHNGSTTLFLGKYITHGTFITDSVSLPELLIRRFPGETGPHLILCGGELDRKGGITYGFKAEQAIAEYHADFMITGISGLDAQGPMDLNNRSIGIQRTMMKHADHVIILADHHKFHRTGPCYISEWKHIDTLITTDEPENQPMCEKIRRQGTNVIALPKPTPDEMTSPTDKTITGRD